jgi:hypothetical protein
VLEDVPIIKQPHVTFPSPQPTSRTRSSPPRTRSASARSATSCCRVLTCLYESGSQSFIITEAESYAPRWVALGRFPQNLTPVPRTRRPDRLYPGLASVLAGLREPLHRLPARYSRYASTSARTALRTCGWRSRGWRPGSPLPGQDQDPPPTGRALHPMSAAPRRGGR